MNKQKRIHQDLISYSPANRMFRGTLDTEGTVLGYVSGMIRCSFLWTLLGTRVQINLK
ncbi:translational initiation factor 1 (plastid) [Oldenlandia corymbosa var. corymbosa]|uniref:Translational initiation factor 1 n=1 Tax=Oldenlandia corymbosa var. corymbosa TaxID=529605 RepID=A0AAV1EHG0_OLDCO|nr:translational initiation factor 1 [Oldenlandia corymbosa var. corymbosa]